MSETLQRNPLQHWVIYDHPRDYPDNYVVRCWETYSDTGSYPVPDVYLVSSVEGARQIIAELFPGGYRIERDEHDDEAIVEIWI